MTYYPVALPDTSPADALAASYRYKLDPALIAQEPAAVRDASRLMVTAGGGTAAHHTFSELPDLLAPGDLLVINDTRVRPAFLTARKDTGGRVRMLVLDPLPDGGWAAWVKGSARLEPGRVLTLVHLGTGAEGPTVTIGEVLPSGARRIDGLTATLQHAWGEMPLPPYIERPDGPRAADSERYQTVYAEHEGAAAAPTAGLHFTPAVFARLEERGIPHARVTLHVGEGTFAPIRVDRLADVHLHAESWSVPAATAAAIAACEARGGRIVAVGTTSCRTLETWNRQGRPADGAFRSTDLFLHPAAPPRMAMALLTNFHTPGSSLVMLVAAFVGRERILELYAEAQTRGYRFFSYGDAMLFL